jgi:urease accessory protein
MSGGGALGVAAWWMRWQEGRDEAELVYKVDYYLAANTADLLHKPARRLGNRRRVRTGRETLDASRTAALGSDVITQPTSVLEPHHPPLQRALGAGRIKARAEDGTTRLERLFQDGCAKIRLPKDHAAHSLEAVLINTAGGLTGGDRLSWRAEAGPGAALTLTTPACEKIYRARDGRAETTASLTLGAGARLDWLPQETILFDGGALSRRLEADLAPDARLLVAEAVVLGRTAMGESVRQGELRDRWRIRREGRLVFADDLAFAGPVAGTADRSPILGGGRAFASLLLVAEDAPRFLAPLRAAIGDAGGASAFAGKLFCRIVAADGLALRRALLPALEVLQDGEPCPRVWRL